MVVAWAPGYGRQVDTRVSGRPVGGTAYYPGVTVPAADDQGARTKGLLKEGRNQAGRCDT